MIARRRVAVLLVFVALACVVTSACNAITGTGKYEVVDCPSGSCDGATTDGQVSGETSTDGGVDTGVGPLPDCGAGLAAVTLTVTGAAGGSVFAKTGGTLTVPTGSTQTACLAAGTVELRTNGPSASWLGPGCKDGNTGRDRCEFALPTAGVAVTAALP